MPRHIYISCAIPERELEEVKSLCDFLSASDFIIQFLPDSENAFYRGIEDAIESVDTFVAVIGEAYSCSSWLNFELHYAYTLRDARMKKRPRIFGLRIGEWNLPRWFEQIELEWLDDDNRPLLLSASSDLWSSET